MLKLARYILTKRKHLLENLSEMQGGCGIKSFTSDTTLKVNRYVLVVTAKRAGVGSAQGPRCILSLRADDGNKLGEKKKIKQGWTPIFYPALGEDAIY